MAKKKDPDNPVTEETEPEMSKVEAAVEKIVKKNKKKAGTVKPKDVEAIIEQEKEIIDIIGKLPKGLQKAANQISLLFEMLKAYWNKEYTEIPFASIGMIVFALVYVISPIDLIPDPIPVIGLVDDAMVVALTVKVIKNDLRDYCEWKGYDPSKYF